VGDSTANFLPLRPGFLPVEPVELLASVPIQDQGGTCLNQGVTIPPPCPRGPPRVPIAVRARQLAALHRVPLSGDQTVPHLLDDAGSGAVSGNGTYARNPERLKGGVAGRMCLSQVPERRRHNAPTKRTAHRRDLVSDRFEVVWIWLWLGALIGADWSPVLFSIAVTVLAAMSAYATILISRGPRLRAESGQDDGDESKRARA
jgi:hypothetical protein